MTVTVQYYYIMKGKTEMIIINKKQDGEKLTVQMAGRLDTQTAPQLETELKEGLNGVKELVFDLKEVEYISSAGLRVILIMHKACTEGVTISGANNAIKEILSQTGFDSIITIV